MALGGPQEHARRALDFLWEKRQRNSNLVGTTINIHSGEWVRRGEREPGVKSSERGRGPETPTSGGAQPHPKRPGVGAGFDLSPSLRHPMVLLKALIEDQVWFVG